MPYLEELQIPPPLRIGTESPPSSIISVPTGFTTELTVTCRRCFHFLDHIPTRITPTEVIKCPRCHHSILGLGANASRLSLASQLSYRTTSSGFRPIYDLPESRRRHAFAQVWVDMGISVPNPILEVPHVTSPASSGARPSGHDFPGSGPDVTPDSDHETFSQLRELFVRVRRGLHNRTHAIFNRSFATQPATENRRDLSEISAEIQSRNGSHIVPSTSQLPSTFQTNTLPDINATNLFPLPPQESVEENEETRGARTLQYRYQRTRYHQSRAQRPADDVHGIDRASLISSSPPPRTPPSISDIPDPRAYQQPMSPYQTSTLNALIRSHIGPFSSTGAPDLILHTLSPISRLSLHETWTNTSQESTIFGSVASRSGSHESLLSRPQSPRPPVDGLPTLAETSTLGEEDHHSV